jgi:hypothetical protein
MIDHINRDGLDNTRANLRSCTNAENQWNTGLYSHNTSGHKGINYDKERNKWQVQLRHNGKKLSFGRYTKLEDAINFYNEKIKELRGVGICQQMYSN